MQPKVVTRANEPEAAVGADQREGWADGKGLFLRTLEYPRSVEDTVYIAGLLVWGKVYGASPSAGKVLYGLSAGEELQHLLYVWNRPINIGPTGARPYGFTLRAHTRVLDALHPHAHAHAHVHVTCTCHQNVRVQPLVWFHPPNLESGDSVAQRNKAGPGARISHSLSVIK